MSGIHQDDVHHAMAVERARRGLARVLAPGEVGSFFLHFAHVAIETIELKASGAGTDPGVAADAGYWALL